jgi:hypothetical protein
MRDLLEACVFLERAPDIEYLDGLFRVTIHIGESQLRLCVAPNLFLAGLFAASKAAQVFDEEQHGPKVLPFVPRGAEVQIA